MPASTTGLVPPMSMGVECEFGWKKVSPLSEASYVKSITRCADLHASSSSATVRTLRHTRTIKKPRSSSSRLTCLTSGVSSLDVVARTAMRSLAYAAGSTLTSGFSGALADLVRKEPRRRTSSAMPATTEAYTRN